MITVHDNLAATLLANATTHNAAAGFNGALDLAKIRLVKAGPNPVHNTPLSAFTTSDFTGYADKTVTWNPQWQRPDGGIVISGQMMQWQMTDTVKPQTVIGYLLLDVTGLIILGAEMFNPPIALLTVLDAVQVTPQFVEGGADHGSATVTGP